MQQLKYITNLEFETTKQYIEQLFNKHQPIVVSFKKSRTNIESYNVTIEGVYQKFFTVKDDKLKANFTIQFFDIITGDVLVSIIKKQEGI